MTTTRMDDVSSSLSSMSIVRPSQQSSDNHSTIPSSSLQPPPTQLPQQSTHAVLAIVRPTEAQLRWAQFHQERVARKVQEQVRRMYLLPRNIQQIPNIIPSDLDGLLEEEESVEAHDDDAAAADSGAHKADDRNQRHCYHKPKISMGRQVLLRVSQRQYEERRQRIIKEGYGNDRNDGEEKRSDTEFDVLDSIFAETNPIRRKYRKRRRSTLRLSTHYLDDTERIQRFEAAYYALLSSLASLESKKYPLAEGEEEEEWTMMMPVKKWSRPAGMTVPTSIDGREYSDWKWGITTTATKSSSSQHQHQAPHMSSSTMFDRTASWMIHIPPKVPTNTNTTNNTTQFTNDMRRHLQDVARHYLRDNHHPNETDNEKVADDDDDVVSFVECFERHLTDVHYNHNSTTTTTNNNNNQFSLQSTNLEGTMQKSDDDEVPSTKAVWSNHMASFVAKYEKHLGMTAKMNTSTPPPPPITTTISPTTADLIRRFENQQIKDGFVQGLVSEIETAIARQQKQQQNRSSGSNLISADGKLYKPAFAQLIQRYLLSITSHTTKNMIRNPFQKKQYSTWDIPSEECNSITEHPEEDDGDMEEGHDDDKQGWDDNGDNNHPHFTKFVQTFIDHFEQQEPFIYETTTENDAKEGSHNDDDDDNHTILTGDGTLNRSVLEHLVYQCIDEASKLSFDEADIASVDVESKTNPPLPSTPMTYHESNVDVNDMIATPVRSIATTTSDVFDRIRSVSAKMKNFRFGRDEVLPNVPTIDNDGNDDDNDDDPKVSNRIVGTVSNKVSELFQNLNMKNTTDEAAYMAFREIQDQKRRSIDPPTHSLNDGDVSSQSSFRILPRGIRNVVNSFRNTITTPHRSRNWNPPDGTEHKLEIERYDNDDENDTTMYDDVESETDVTNDNAGGEGHDSVGTQPLAHEQEFSAGISGSMDTDGSIISGNGQHSTNRVGLMAGIMLSPTLLTKRHQQAIRAVESYNWAQVKYLLSANPWLAEMADVNTNQYVLHKLAYYGSGQLRIDHVTGEVLSIRNAPAPESLNVDLLNLFPSSVHKFDHDGNLPLHMAALSANLPMIQLLGDKFSSGASVRNEDGMLPLHLVIIACASPLVVTIGSDIEPVDVVQGILQYFPGAVGVADNEGNLPIHTAASVLRGSDGATIVSWLLDEAEKQVLGPSLLRFRSKNAAENMYDDLDVNTELSQCGSSVHGDESTNCLCVENELGQTPLLLAIQSQAGWEVIEALVQHQSDIFHLDSEHNNVLHLLVSEQYKDPAAALKVLSQRPEAARMRNDKGMLPIEIACLQMLPKEIILALALVDLPISLDATKALVPEDGFGASWWYLVCECDDYYVNIVQEIVSICTFRQIRSLCLLQNGVGDVLLGRATPKCRSVLDAALRIVGRYEFIESSPIYTGTDFAAFNALDFGSQLDPIPDGKSVILMCYTTEESFLKNTAAIRDLQLNVLQFEEILLFEVDPTDSNRGPLPEDGIRRYFVAVEKPKVTLATVVRGMLANRSCQTDTAVRQRYSGKVFTVLRSIAKALFELHSQRYVHGNLTVHSCAKFDDKWKLSNLLDTKRFGEILPLSVDTYAIPPEALQKTTQHGSQGQVFLKHDYVASPSIDIWAFGMVAFEALVGKPLFAGIGDTDNKTDSLMEILQWNDAVFEEAKRELRSIGVFDSGIALIGDCLSPHEAARPQIEDILQHKFWSQC